jgi:hypothetical protein
VHMLLSSPQPTPDPSSLLISNLKTANNGNPPDRNVNVHPNPK